MKMQDKNIIIREMIKAKNKNINVISPQCPVSSSANTAFGKNDLIVGYTYCNKSCHVKVYFE